jgi:hypothetical protein
VVQRQQHGLVEQAVGQSGKLVRHLGHVQLSEDVAQRDPQNLLVLETAHAAQHQLRVAADAGQPRLQLGPDLGRGLAEGLGVPGDQLVEQLRAANEFGAQVGALAKQVEQPPRHRRSLLEQTHVAGRHRQRRDEFGQVEERLVRIGTLGRVAQ